MEKINWLYIMFGIMLGLEVILFFTITTFLYMFNFTTTSLDNAVSVLIAIHLLFGITSIAVLECKTIYEV